MRLLATLLVLSALCLTAPLGAEAAPAPLDSPVGLWQPLDSSGKPQGLIRIFEAGGLYYGQIEPSSPSDDRNARCTHCTGKRHDQPIIGLVIMRHLKPQNGGEYVGGDILDPNTGHVYHCTLRLTDGGHRLIMRGFLGISLFGRSEIWRRVETRAR
jgi:uncharacterized protein (DUF2147 family)